MKKNRIIGDNRRNTVLSIGSILILVFLHLVVTQKCNTFSLKTFWKLINLMLCFRIFHQCWSPWESTEAARRQTGSPKTEPHSSENLIYYMGILTTIYLCSIYTKTIADYCHCLVSLQYFILSVHHILFM